MELLWCVVPKVDDVMHAMPSVNNHINSLKLHATARFDSVTATRLLLSEHVIRFDLWSEFGKAMRRVGLERNAAYQHVAAAVHRASTGKPKAGEELPSPDKRHCA